MPREGERVSTAPTVSRSPRPIGFLSDVSSLRVGLGVAAVLGLLIARARGTCRCGAWWRSAASARSSGTP
ncbi:hypothetical protein OG417_17615 [Actinoallomurus sp. NBC_01490]|uniref:hypothetical protein n=1 Tax=Actinoallomurus sp. NBC_01490 TaxID=2903557 RepID=UPI002E300CD3|nr:hypothetical protein [Actinoallomurus sp. NBC_01490]